MTPEAPKISILMPSFNQGRYLEPAIRSVLTQDYKNRELIVIDGGSTDTSVAIIRKYQDQIAYWVSEPDRGQTHALNKAREKASGDIIGWLNSDDRYLPGAFRRVAKAFASNSDALVVHGDRVTIDQNGLVSGWSALPPFDPQKSGYVICSETAFWRSAPTAKVPFEERLRFAMDLDYFCRLYQMGRFVKLDSYLGAFRCYPENKSSTMPDVGRDEAEAQWDAIFGFGSYRGRWQEKVRTRKATMLFRLLRHPLAIAVPYLYRRMWLGLRGVAAEN